ncbi:MAG: pyridoxal phosphate-dependent aminotransferase, partial [Chloroflexota bacterium]
MLTSTFGNKFSSDLGILQLMDDLGKYVGKPGYIMLGGGNPSRIPAVETYFQTALARILEDKSRFSDMISAYSGPEGDLRFRKALATFLSNEYGWPITAENIVLTNGSQTAFFYLFNLFSGRFADGSFKKILLPLTPEYIGYGDAGIGDNHFIAYRSTIDILEDRLFKYHVDFNAIEVTEDIGAICVSRPTNPTGNVLDGDEIEQLGQLAKAHSIPLIVDNAYGLPFPNIIFTDENPTWEPHMIMCMSLSKLGLPGTRTGIIIASDEVIRKMTGINAVMSLAPGNFGPAIALEAIESGEIKNLSHNLIRPHYKRKVWHAIDALRE